MMYAKHDGDCGGGDDDDGDVMKGFFDADALLEKLIWFGLRYICVCEEQKTER